MKAIARSLMSCRRRWIRRGRERQRRRNRAATAQPWLAIVVLGLSGFASLVHEIAWTRILALVLGPTTYAFAATLAAVVAGVAIGSGAGAWFVARIKAGSHAGWLAFVLAAGAITIVVTSALAGRYVPSAVAHQIAASPDSFSTLLRQGMLLTASLILPTAICLGAAFPLALSMAGDPAYSAARRFGLVYAVNTIGSVTGTLAAGFVLIPWLGLPTTLAAAAFVLVVAAVALMALANVDARVRNASYLMSGVAVVAIVVAPQWDRELLAERRLPLRAVRPQRAGPRHATASRHAALLQGRRAGDGLRETPHRHDDARGGRQDRRVQSQRHAHAEAGRAPAAAASPGSRATSRSSGSEAASRSAPHSAIRCSTQMSWRSRPKWSRPRTSSTRRITGRWPTRAHA